MPDPWLDSMFASRDSGPPAVLDLPALRSHLQRQANLITDTGTGGQPFAQADPDYKATDTLVCANFRRFGLEPPFPWRSLWEWHGYYSRNLPTYQSRREHVRSLTSAALEQLDTVEHGTSVHDPGGGEDHEIGWDSINVRISALIEEYRTAQDRDTWQDVGRRSREILIDLGKVIADPALVAPGVTIPKGADARAWFDIVVDHQAAGKDKAELRALMRKTWDLAQKVTHGDIDDVDAFASAQATVLLVRTTQKLIST